MGEWDYLDQTFPHITSSAVAEILVRHGFDLALAGHDWEWLAMAVRRMLALDQPPAGHGPDEANANTVAHESISRLGQQASTLAADLKLLRGGNLESVVYELVRSVRDGGDVHKELDRLAASLECFSGYLKNEVTPYLVKHWPQQRGPWRRKAARKLRQMRGLRLAPVFEEVFGREVTVTKAEKPTPFMCFYQSMVHLAVGEAKTPDLAAVLAAARGWRKWWLEDNPVSYAGVVPGLRLLDQPAD